MRILKFSAERFRSLKSIREWTPGRLNVLIGPNGSGKSNVLRAIDLLAASAQGRLARTIQAEGGMEPLLWDGEGKVFSLEVECAGEGGPEFYQLELRGLGNGGDFQVSREFLSVGQQSFLERTGVTVKLPGKPRFLNESEVPAQETVLAHSKGPFTDHTVLSRFRAELAGFSVYHDFQTHRNAPARQATVTRYEKRVDADGQNLISVLHTLYTGDRDFKSEVNDAMRAAFGPDFEELVFPPAADQRIQLRVRWKSLRREQSAADLSDGTLRFLFLLAVLASPDPAPVIAIDEPETGLHPSMMPIIAEYAVAASGKAQVFLTTHSPQFLDAFSGTRPMTTVVQREDGETTLKVPDQSRLEDWLEEYSLGSLFRSGELEGMA